MAGTRRLNREGMATALRQLPQQPVPSAAVIPGLLDGLPSVGRLARRWLEREEEQRNVLTALTRRRW